MGRLFEFLWSLLKGRLERNLLLKRSLLLESGLLLKHGLLLECSLLLVNLLRSE